MDLELAEAYKALEETLAGDDLLEFLDQLLVTYNHELLGLSNPDDVFRCQGKLMCLRDIKERFEQANRMRERFKHEQAEKLSKENIRAST